MAHPLDGAYLRVTRAQEHFTDLDKVLAIYAAENLKQVGTFDVDPQTFQPDIKDFHILEVPGIASVLTGELIYNLRAALDYLVFELARRDAGTEQDGTQFLIEDSPAGFARRSKTYLRGVSDPHRTAIEDFQPYKGVHWTRRLRELSNPDKHRKLYEHETSIKFHIRHQFGPQGSFAHRHGMILSAKGPGGQDVYMELQAVTDVLFRDTSTLLLPLVPLLKELLIKVPETLQAFESEF